MNAIDRILIRESEPSHATQKVDYAKLLNDDDDDDESNAGDAKAFSSDDDFGTNGKAGGSDIDTPVKKPVVKRKLAPKATTATAPAAGKRTKKVISDSDSSDFGGNNVSDVLNELLRLAEFVSNHNFFHQIQRKKRNTADSDSDSDFL